MRGLLLVAIVVLCSGACDEPAPVFSDAHAAAIRDSANVFLAEFRRLSSEGKTDSVGELYSDRADFRFLESGEIRYRSAAEVRTALDGMPAGIRIDSEYDDMSVQAPGPGQAVVSAKFRTRFADSTGVEQFAFGGVLTMVLQHEDEGWRIIAGHSSAPVPRG